MSFPGGVFTLHKSAPCLFRIYGFLMAFAFFCVYIFACSYGHLQVVLIVFRRNLFTHVLFSYNKQLTQAKTGSTRSSGV